MLTWEPLSVESGRKDFGLNSLEEQIIALIVAGYSSEESAEIIGVSEPALRLHLLGIYDKLKVSNRLELVLFSSYHHLIDAV